MALTQPQLAELKRYSFFVSRRLEDGRERFRLHMGYFDSLLQAEELLPVVREIYPGAWAGEAPGKRLRARAAASNPAPAATPSVPAAPPLPAGPSAELLARMPTLSAAPEPNPVPPPPLPPPPVLELVPQPARVPPPAPVAPPPPPVAAAAAVPVPAPPRAATPTAPPARAAGAKRAASVPFDQRSNVREVLNSLDETARKPSVPVAPPVAPVGPVVRQPGVLPESQVLHLLEEKRGDPLNTTSTPAAFAIQLQWSVQAIDLTKVPPLAIFGAYTLYTVEGSREGRRWFGLRLGFFSDANSAKQVAQYVRSEFSSVAVVPVSLKERDGASGASGGIGSGAPAPQRPTERLVDRSAEFKLLDDTDSAPQRPSAAAKAASAAAAAGNSAVAKPKSAAAGKLGATRPGQKGAKTRGRVNAHERRSPQTLEETLEILGAGELQIEGARRELISEGQIRHVDVKVQKNSPFTRLLDRLAERGR
jgi:hypothetical protein